MSIKMILSAVLLVIVFITGIWMSKLGKPYHTILFNIHKLISLVAIVVAIITVINFNKEIGLNPLQLSLTIGIAVILVFTLVTGGILSAKQDSAKMILMAHKFLPIIFVIGLSGLFILIFKAS